MASSFLMDPKQNVPYLRQVHQAVLEFQESFTRFLSLHEENVEVGIGRGLLPAVAPKAGTPPEKIVEAGRRVSRAAGRAAFAPGLTRMYINVSNQAEPIDPVAAWRSMTLPKPILEAGDILDAIEQMLGRLEGMIWKAEAEAPSTTGVEAMHPTIWGASRKLWLDGHYRSAVHSASEALTAQLKARVGENGLDATALYGKVFNDNGGLLRWPGDADDLTVRSMRSGLGKYAPGVNMTIRNTAAHGTTDMSAQDAMERLAALSLLARWLDASEDVPKSES